MENWTKENEKELSPQPDGKIAIPWFNNKAIFYANAHKLCGWCHKNAPAKPYTKGEGLSLIIGEFITANFRWLESPDGKQSMCIIMKPGKS